MFKARTQHGVALISVLLITALVTLIISDMLARQHLSLISSASRLVRQQLWHLALSGEVWARQQLLTDLQEKDGLQRIHLGQRWATGTPVFEIEGRIIRIHIEDLSARFNLNRLRTGSDRVSAARYQRRLALLGLPPHDPSRLTSALQADGKPLSFADSSELLRLEQVSTTGLQRLRPWVSAVDGAALNLNTASAELLACLEGLDLGIARALVQSRLSMVTTAFRLFSINCNYRGAISARAA